MKQTIIILFLLLLSVSVASAACPPGFPCHELLYADIINPTVPGQSVLIGGSADHNYMMQDTTVYGQIGIKTATPKANVDINSPAGEYAMRVQGAKSTFAYGPINRWQGNNLFFADHEHNVVAETLHTSFGPRTLPNYHNMFRPGETFTTLESGTEAATITISDANGLDPGTMATRSYPFIQWHGSMANVHVRVRATSPTRGWVELFNGYVDFAEDEINFLGDTSVLVYSSTAPATDDFPITALEYVLTFDAPLSVDKHISQVGFYNPKLPRTSVGFVSRDGGDLYGPLVVRGYTYIDQSHLGGTPTVDLAIDNTSTGIEGSPGELKLVANDEDILYITAQGNNVGIDTVEPKAKVSIEGAHPIHMVTSPTQAIGFNTYYSGGTWRYDNAYYAAKIDMQGDELSFDIAFDGSAGGEPDFKRAISIQPNGDTGFVYKDVQTCTGTTGSVITRPNGNYHTVGWLTGAGTGTFYERVDEASPDDDASYIYNEVNGGWYDVIFNAGNPTIPAGSQVGSIDIVTECRIVYTQTGDRGDYQGLLYINGNTRVGATRTSGMSEYVTRTWTFTPNSGETFTQTSINDMRIGVNTRGYWVAPEPPGPPGEASFRAGTQVLLANNQYKNIEDVVVGDVVVVYEPDSETFSTSKVIGTTSEEKPLVIINDVLGASTDHKIYVSGQGFVRADTIKIGDRLIDENGNHVAVFSVNTQEATEKVYDIDVEDVNAFFADGILVHNAEAHRPDVRCTQIYARINYNPICTTAEGLATLFVDYSATANLVGIGTNTPARPLTIQQSGAAMALYSGVPAGHNYIEYYTDGASGSGTTRSGWIGYGWDGTPDLSITNQKVGGDIVLNPGTGGGVTIPGVTGSNAHCPRFIVGQDDNNDDSVRAGRRSYPPPTNTDEMYDGFLTFRGLDVNPGALIYDHCTRNTDGTIIFTTPRHATTTGQYFMPGNLDATGFFSATRDSDISLFTASMEPIIDDAASRTAWCGEFGLNYVSSTSIGGGGTKRTWNSIFWTTAATADHINTITCGP